MSLVNVLNVIVKQSKTAFTDDIAFEIFFEAIKPLQHSLTWRIVYIGQASTDEFDQVLEEAEVDCEQAARMRFELKGHPPAVQKLPAGDIVGVTAILLTCSYNGTHEFFRVGYYVNNAYAEDELNENPPPQPIIEKLTRHILVEKPRVTKF